MDKGDGFDRSSAGLRVSGNISRNISVTSRPTVYTLQSCSNYNTNTEQMVEIDVYFRVKLTISDFDGNT